MLTNNEYVSTGDAARILDCGPDYVRALVRQGRLTPAVTTSAGKILLRTDVERLAAERRAASETRGQR